MRERRLAGTRPRAAAHDRGHRRAVVRRAERRLRDQRPLGRDETGDRVDARHLQRLGRLERRQDRRQAPRQHRLARSRRPGQKEVVASGRCDLERAPRAVVAAHLGEVRECRRRPRRLPVRLPVELRLAAQVRQPPRRGGGRGSARRLRARPPRPRARDRAACPAPRASRLGDGEHAADAPQPTVEPELADRRVHRRGARAELTRRREDRERDRRSNAEPSLRCCAGREVDRDQLRGPVELRGRDAGCARGASPPGRRGRRGRRSRSRGRLRMCTFHVDAPRLQATSACVTARARSRHARVRGGPASADFAPTSPRARARRSSEPSGRRTPPPRARASRRP